VTTADDIIARLKLEPHPEGGHYRQTFRAADGARGASTAIYFLLKAGERSHWHKVVDADELWLPVREIRDGAARLGAGLARGSGQGLYRPATVQPRVPASSVKHVAQTHSYSSPLGKSLPVV